MKKANSNHPAIKYIHTDYTHNLRSPSIIVPEILKLLNPKSVIDIGCGIGTFLNIFDKCGISDYIGVDGDWVREEQLLIDTSHFRRFDLEKEFNLNRVFDLVVCVEVVEHLSESSANTIIRSLANHGKIILFSAAIKNQGGQNHVNEQYIDYWQDKFQKQGYFFYDVCRPLFWNNNDVQWWYRQNLFLVIHESMNISPDIASTRLPDASNTYVHPGLLNFYHNLYMEEADKNRDLEEKLAAISSGKESLLFYIKSLVKKSLKVFK